MLRFDPDGVSSNGAFWALVDRVHAARPELRRALATLSPDELLAFAANVAHARELVRPSSAGPVIAEGGRSYTLSDDGTERLCDWIVSMGRATWEQHRGASDAMLAAAYAGKRDVGGMLHVAASREYEARVGRGTFLDALEALVDAAWSEE